MDHLMNQLVSRSIAREREREVAFRQPDRDQHLQPQQSRVGTRRPPRPRRGTAPVTAYA